MKRKQKIIFLKGLPGSGKTTWAKEHLRSTGYCKRINKDDLRDMLDAGVFSREKENYILCVRDILITDALKLGFDVIVDDTNLHPKHEQGIRALATVYGVEVEVKFFDVPVKDCIARDLKRPNSVGEKVIKAMYKKRLAPKPIRTVNGWQDPNLPHAVICDLDGTLAIHQGRSPYDAEKCDTDKVNESIKGLVTGIGHQIIYVSGRDDKWKEKTIGWLNDNRIYPFMYKLHMRKTGDNRPDYIIKKEIYEEHIT